MHADWIIPDWPAPARVRAVSTTRNAGVSSGVYASLNLGAHVGDAAESVAENRRRLRDALKLPREPRWLRQIHGNRVIKIDDMQIEQECDAAYTSDAGQICTIMAADCLPVLLCNRKGTVVAAAHAGWRGMAAGVLEATLAAMAVPTESVLAWLGPAIGPDAYEVGEEVRSALTRGQPQADQAFESIRDGKWLCDLYLLAGQRLRQAGVPHVYGGGFCTHTERARFFSYRRDGECGRMGTLIWIAD
ncbi:MAG: peptidoglycan editing factor PgeF [Gammaproteobacteria bacterium]|nr:peptidoglycan editing factor PgeF [Gammaproteobacteria bacterium]MDE2346078.1 peptidoglycan editing factor PgeF [Gammaproteobacteria bacterium]